MWAIGTKYPVRIPSPLIGSLSTRKYERVSNHGKATPKGVALSASEIVRGSLGNACSAEKIIAPLEVVVDGLLAYGRVDVGEAAELVVVVLEGVGINRADRNAVCLLTWAASAIFSCGVRRVPGVPNIVNRVPELPKAQGEFDGQPGDQRL